MRIKCGLGRASGNMSTGHRHHGADRLDPICGPMFVDERGHHFRRQSSTTCAKYADVFGRITFARLSALSDFTRIGPSLFHLGHGLENGTRLEEFIVSASSDDAPAFHDEDRVAGADRAESMGDHDYRLGVP